MFVMQRLKKHTWTFLNGIYRLNTNIGSDVSSVCVHTAIAGFHPIKPRRRIVTRRSRHFHRNKTRKRRNTSDKDARGAGKWKDVKGKDVSVGGRRFGKQVNNKHERGVDATGSRRCGSITKETQGRTEGRRNTAVGHRRRCWTMSSLSPVHGPREGREGRREKEELFWSASLQHRSQGATVENNELTSRLLTSRENMAAQTDTPSDQRYVTINNNQ